MRELPDPEGYLCDWGNDPYGLPRTIVYYGEPGSASLDDWNESPKVHKNTPIFTRDQVLAIQKQAYEDGLRDAADRADSVGHHWSGAPAHAFFGLAESLRAMLTASQKEQK